MAIISEYILNYTEQNYKRNTFVFAPIFHELNSKIEYFFYVHKRPISLKYYSQICMPIARSLKTCVICVVLFDETAHFRVAFCCVQHKAHLCNNHAV